jgi:drug/metabolite transporter (DMT)-like permease
LLKSRSTHSRAVGQLILAALCWSLGGLLIKTIPWTGLAISGGRGLFAAIFLILTNRGLRFHGSLPQILGALGYAGCTVLFCVANKYTTAANAILLQYTAPVWVALFGAWFLGERATRADWVTIAAVLGGMTLFFADGLEMAHGWGNFLGLLSGVAFGGMTLALRHQKDTSAVESIILGNLIAFLVGIPALLGSPALPPRGWAALLTLGIVQLGVSYWLYARAIKAVTALEAVLIPVLEPILNPVWVLLAVGEKPSPPALLGGGIVLTAVTVRALRTRRAPRAAAASAE